MKRQGRSQILAVKDQIIEKIETGEYLNSIFYDLTAQGKITICRAVFYRQVNKQILDKAPSKVSRSVLNPAACARAALRSIKTDPYIEQEARSDRCLQRNSRSLAGAMTQNNPATLVYARNRLL